MKSGDLITVIGGIAIVIVIALIANPHYLAEILPAVPAATPAPASTATPTPLPSAVTPARTLNPGVPAPRPTVVPPYRIFYSNKPLSYPVFTLPENMNIFGASDIPLRSNETVTFAYVEDTRGGLTQTFTVPYPVWILNTTVTSEINPQYGNFRMVLCYAGNGTIVTGEEILNRGTAYHVVEVSNTPMYMIISTAYIDKYRITLETPRIYYDQYTRH